MGLREGPRAPIPFFSKESACRIISQPWLGFDVVLPFIESQLLCRVSRFPIGQSRRFLGMAKFVTCPRRDETALVAGAVHADALVLATEVASSYDAAIADISRILPTENG